MSTCYAKPVDVPDIRDLIMAPPRKDAEADRIQQEVIKNSPVSELSALFLHKWFSEMELACFNEFIRTSTDHCRKFVPVATDISVMVRSLRAKMKLLLKMEDSQVQYYQQMDSSKNADLARTLFKERNNESLEQWKAYIRGLANYYFNDANKTEKLLNEQTSNLAERRRALAEGNFDKKYNDDITDFVEFYIQFLTEAKDRQLQLCRLAFSIHNCLIDVSDKHAVVTQLVQWKKSGLEEMSVRGVRNIQFNEFRLLTEMFMKNADDMSKDYHLHAVKKDTLERLSAVKHRTRLSETTLAACHAHRQLSRLVLEDARMLYSDMSILIQRELAVQRTIHSAQLNTLDLDFQLLMELAVHNESFNKNLNPKYPKIYVEKELLTKEDHIERTTQKLNKAFSKMCVSDENRKQKLISAAHDKEMRKYDKIVEAEKDVQQENFAALYSISQDVVYAFARYMNERKEARLREEKNAKRAVQEPKINNSKQ
uniref:Coiled-coil domain-containing protein 63 n=1 Tax=Caenorhabditis tropicalis TaxID=1561998 RepID=A0A1I7U061_9PELO